MPRWLRRIVRSGEVCSDFPFSLNSRSAARNSGVSSTRVWMYQASASTNRPIRNGMRQPQAANADSEVKALTSRKTVLAVTTPMGTPSWTTLP